VASHVPRARTQELARSTGGGKLIPCWIGPRASTTCTTTWLPPTMEDRTALEILLSALVPCPRTPALWLIIETNWYSRRCDNAWFAFGGEWAPYSLGELRSLRHERLGSKLTRGWRSLRRAVFSCQQRNVIRDSVRSGAVGDARNSGTGFG
jgi:hypothetical protein